MPERDGNGGEDEPFRPPESISYQPETIQILVYSDVACPWSYIGHRRLQEALQAYRDSGAAQPITVECKPYAIDPGAPSDGEPRADYCRRRWGTADPDWLPRLKAAGATVGAAFADWRWWPSSKAPQEFIHYGSTVRRQDATRLYAVLFEHLYEKGRNVGRIDELLRIAEAEFPDWDRGDLRRYLERGAAARAMRDDMQQGRRCYRIGRTPFFLVYSEAAGLPPVGFSGAQLPATFLQVFEELNEKTERRRTKMGTN